MTLIPATTLKCWAIGAVILGAPPLAASGGNEMNAASRDLHQDDLGDSAILGRITAHHSEFLRFIAARVREPPRQKTSSNQPM